MAADHLSQLLHMPQNDIQALRLIEEVFPLQIVEEPDNQLPSAPALRQGVEQIVDILQPSQVTVPAAGGSASLCWTQPVSSTRRRRVQISPFLIPLA